MVGPNDLLVWKDVAIGGCVVVSGLTAFVVNTFTKRLDKHEKEDRETFTKIFSGQETIATKLNDGFRDLDRAVSESSSKLTENVNGIHVKLLERISDVQQDLTGKNYS